MTDAKPPDGEADVAAYSVSETFKDSPLLNSTLMNAMRDYFGDDGREIQDYMKRPLNSANEPMFRIVVIGSGAREVAAAQAFSRSGVISGLYYCPDEDAACHIEMSKHARSATVSAYKRPADVVRFAKWCVADAVFVGPEREGCISRESEKLLADAGITLFPHDVTAAIADGTLDVRECLAPLAETEEEEERLVE